MENNSNNGTHFQQALTWGFEPLEDLLLLWLTARPAGLGRRHFHSKKSLRAAWTQEGFAAAAIEPQFSTSPGLILSRPWAVTGLGGTLSVSALIGLQRTKLSQSWCSFQVSRADSKGGEPWGPHGTERRAKQAPAVTGAGMSLGWQRADASLLQCLAQGCMHVRLPWPHHPHP